MLFGTPSVYPNLINSYILSATPISKLLTLLIGLSNRVESVPMIVKLTFVRWLVNGKLAVYGLIYV